MKIGLVLSGGGAKGAVHLGVLKFLREEGIEPDIYAGTSAGAIVASLIAIGLTPDEIKDSGINIKLKPLRNITKLWGSAGLINTNEIKEIIEDLLINKGHFTGTFEDLETPLYIPATNMLTGDEVVFSKDSDFSKTPLLDAMLASASYPFVFSPMLIDDVLYSDGGILNHFPVDTIRSKSDYLIGVFLSPQKTLNKEDLKSSKSIILRALNLQGSLHEKEKMKDCDCLITPVEIKNYQTFDMSEKRINELFNIGYNSMKSKKEEIKTLKKIMRYKKLLGK